MKKSIVIVLLMLSVLFILSCNTPKITSPPVSEPVSPSPSQTPSPLPPAEIKVTESPVPSAQPTPPPATSKPTSQPITKPAILPPVLAPEKRTTPPITLPTPIISSQETFDGTVIDNSKYKTQLTGSAFLNQDNKISMSGNSTNGIAWASLYTLQKYNQNTDYNLSVYVNLTGPTTIGTANAVVGLETLPTLISGKNSEQGYCELSIGQYDKTLRMSRSVGHLIQDASPSGILNIYWNKKLGKLTCTFNDLTITQYQIPLNGEYYASIRGGINYLSSGGLESAGLGSFQVTFDNFSVKQE